jgi:serine/threonine-protein kinase
MASALNHPHICTVHEIGESQGQYFIVTELLQGQNLQHILAQGPLEANRACDLALQIADGLSAAHDRGIVHRDLKPSNIFLTEQGRVKLLDFGLAKPAESQLPYPADAPTIPESATTRPWSAVGTLAYMPPEQLRNLPITPAADVFSFGIVLCEMLTGVHPFARGTPFETASSILCAAFPPTDRKMPPVPEPWLPILQKMLSKNPSERYSTAHEVRADLLRLRTGAGGEVRAAASPPSPSIAVLPFRSLSRDPDNEYFSDGLTEELINRLSNLGDLRVAARSSSFRFRGKELDIRQIGIELGVSSILEGSVQRSGNRIRITGQLINVCDGFQLWAGKYDRELSEVFALQDEIAQAVVSSLAPALKPPAPVPRRRTSPEAYNAYLQGRYFWNKRTAQDFRKAIECFRKAIALDSKFAEALAGIADSYMTLAIYGAEAPEVAFPFVKESAQKALDIDAELAEAHTSLGGAEAIYDWNWQSAERHFQSALASSPKYATAHHWYATNCLLPRARFVEAGRELQLARELEPLSLAIATSWGFAHFLEGKYEAAIEELTKVISMDRNFGLAHYFLGQTYIEKGMFQDGIRELQASVELGQRSPESVAALGWAYAKGGQAEEASGILKDLRQCARSAYVSPVLLAQIELGLGKKKEALDYLDEGHRKRAADLVWLKVRPAFAELRGEARFIELCNRIGLTS